MATTRSIKPLLFACCFSASSSSATDVEKIEYFTGSDPGFGNGTELGVTSDAATIDFDTSSLTPGIHRIFLRAKDADGVWGPTTSFIFRVKASSEILPEPVEAAEWFVGTDPGFGSGNPANLDEVSKSFTTETENLSGGHQRVHFRVKDSDGKWGHTSSFLGYARRPDPGIPLNAMKFQVVDRDGVEKENGRISVDPVSPINPRFVQLNPSSYRTYLEKYSVSVQFESYFEMQYPFQLVSDFLVEPEDMDWVRASFSENEIFTGDASFRFDSDGDTAPNYQEYLSLTDPRDSTSVDLPTTVISDNFLTLRYSRRSGGDGRPGRDYQVAGLQLVPQSSIADQGFEWLAGPNHIEVLGTPEVIREGVEKVTIRQKSPISAQRAGFLRINHR